MRTAVLTAFSPALALAAFLTACGKGPTEPSEISGTPVLPPPPSPPFEFSVSGGVQDTAWRPIADVRIEIVDGPGIGRFAVTDAHGHYALPGMFSDTIAVRASKDGYVTVTKTHRPSFPGTSGLGFLLELNSPSVNMAGDYTLTFTADGACTQLPAEARTRTYTAAVKPAKYDPSPYVYDGALSGAKFYEYRDTLRVHVAGNFALFLFDEAPEVQADDRIIEELAPSTYVSFDGTADAIVGESTVSAPFNAAITYCTGSADPTRCTEPVTCYSSNHRLALTRR